MKRRNCEGEDGTHRVNARDVVGIRRTLDELGIARCPLCRAMLVARQGRAGPYFYCACLTTARKRAS